MLSVVPFEPTDAEEKTGAKASTHWAYNVTVASLLFGMLDPLDICVPPEADVNHPAKVKEVFCGAVIGIEVIVEPLLNVVEPPD